MVVTSATHIVTL